MPPTPKVFGGEDITKPSVSSTWLLQKTPASESNDDIFSYDTQPHAFGYCWYYCWHCTTFKLGLLDTIYYYYQKQ